MIMNWSIRIHIKDELNNPTLPDCTHESTLAKISIWNKKDGHLEQKFLWAQHLWVGRR